MEPVGCYDGGLFIVRHAVCQEDDNNRNSVTMPTLLFDHRPSRLDSLGRIRTWKECVASENTRDHVVKNKKPTKWWVQANVTHLKSRLLLNNLKQ